MFRRKVMSYTTEKIKEVASNKVQIRSDDDCNKK